MSAPRLHETLIADRIVQLIDENLSVEMGLKVVTLGSLDFFPALPNLMDNVPAVFVKASPTTNLERITTGQTYRITYNFRLVFVKAFGPNEQIVRDKTVETQKIGELLIDNVELGQLALPNGQVLSSLLKVIEWDPPEDNMVMGINANLTATALAFMVDTSSRK